MAKKDDVHIAFIKFVKKKTAETGVLTMDECQEFLADNFSDLNPKFQNHLIDDLTVAVIIPQGEGPQNLRKLKVKSYFYLLEHTELEAARASSKKALCVANFAIVISIIIGAVSIYQQFNTPHMLIDDPVIVIQPHEHSY